MRRLPVFALLILIIAQIAFSAGSFTQSGITLSVNGRGENVAARPGSYVTVGREWKTGDTVLVRLPMSLRTDNDAGRSIRDCPARWTHPGDLGKEGLDTSHRYGPALLPSTGCEIYGAGPSSVGQLLVRIVQ